MKTFCLAVVSFFCLLSITYGTDSDVLITWQKPLLNVNGTTCFDYLGVKVFQRVDNEEYNYDRPLTVVYKDLFWIKSDFTKSGEYHWILQSFDTSNNMCPDYTEEVSKTIKVTIPAPPHRLTYR